MGEIFCSSCCEPLIVTSRSIFSETSEDSISLLKLLKGPEAELKNSPLFRSPPPIKRLQLELLPDSEIFETPPPLREKFPFKLKKSRPNSKLKLLSEAEERLDYRKGDSKQDIEKVPVFTINLYEELPINMINRPSLIARGGLKFIVMDAPSQENAIEYALDLSSRGVIHLVRTCEGKYDDEVFESRGIKVHVKFTEELYFTDGSAPPRSIINEWLQLVEATFFEKGKIKKASDETPSIAVHCLAGLGRAPVLVAIALIEAGLDQNNAVSLIRKSRQGALNFY